MIMSAAAKRCLKLERLSLHQMCYLPCELVDDMCQQGMRALQEVAFLGTPVATGALLLLQSK